MARRIEDGEHLAQVVAESGFFGFRAVWNAPENQALRDKRKNPHILLAGDEVTIREPEPRTTETKTGFVHRFRIKAPPLELRIALLGFDRKPVAGRACKLEVEERSVETTTTEDGTVALVIPNTATAGTLSIDGVTSPVEIGRLSPIDEGVGWKGRLVNLGYLEPPAEGEEPDGDEARSALEEFQVDHGLKVTGEPDAATLAKLEEVHGC